MGRRAVGGLQLHPGGRGQSQTGRQDDRRGRGRGLVSADDAVQLDAGTVRRRRGRGAGLGRAWGEGGSDLDGLAEGQLDV